MASAALTLGLDVGGTKIAAGLVDGENEVVVQFERPTLVDGRRDPGLHVTYALTRDLLAEASAAGRRVDGIGAGFPEYVDRCGRLSSHEVLEWTVQPRELLADLAPVTIEADVRCAALGEGAAGAAQGRDSFVLAIVGTGLSYALVEDGSARQGARGEAIAFGELEVSRSVDAASTLTLERYASGRAIQARYEAGSGQTLSGAADVFRLRREGDRLAAAITASAARALGHGLVTLTRLLDPGAIVIGGGVAAAGSPWRDEVSSAFDTASTRAGSPPILWATLGSRAGIIGAALAHRRRMATKRAAGTLMRPGGPFDLDFRR